MKKKTKKLGLTRETLTNLDSEALDRVDGAAIACQESRLICSVMHTCVSCVRTELCA
jgi:hypothetical protein